MLQKQLRRRNQDRWRHAPIDPLEPRRLLAKTIYVDDSSPGPTRDGTSWSTAYADLQLALAAAATGDTIKVGAGIYKPATIDRLATFNLKSGVGLYGGYAGSASTIPDLRDWNTYPSVLSGDIGLPGDRADNSYRILTASSIDSGAVFDGFTISGASASNYNGPGLLLSSSSPSISNCIFEDNTTVDGYGGAVYASSSASVFRNCTFRRNSGDGGGAFRSTTGSNNSFINCTFVGNTAGFGGAVALQNSAPAQFTNCLFVGNSSATSGGAIYTEGNTSLVNCTIVANAAGRWGGAIWSYASSAAANCIVWSNTAPNGSQIFIGGGSLTATYCDVAGGYAGTGNVNVDPRFLGNPSAGPDWDWGTPDDDYGDLRISTASLLVDAGRNLSVPAGITTDYWGNPRFRDIPTTTDTGSGTSPLVDMGACEASAAIIAHAGGPYVVLATQSLTLSGRGANSIPGTLQYAWEWSGDGLFNEAAGLAPTFPVSSFTPGSVINVSLRVTGAGSQSAIGTTSVYIAPQIAYVDPVATTGTADGTSWNNAFTSLAAALTQAPPGQTIRVAQGIYKPSSSNKRAMSFSVKSGVKVYGGYGGLSSPDPDTRDTFIYASTLSGDIGTPGVKTDNSYTVVLLVGADSSTILDGLTITGGYADQSPGGEGGGAYIPSGQPVFNNCTFVDNIANSAGGGVYMNGASAKFTSCVFADNMVYYGEGGAIYGGTTTSITGCYFVENVALRGGAIASSGAKLIQCTFVRNAADLGAAVYASSPEVTYCAFYGNNGTAIYNSSTSPTIKNCLFVGNIGAIFNTSSSPKIYNCTFAENLLRGAFDTPLFDRAVTNVSSSSPTITNCIIWSRIAVAGTAITSTGGSPIITYSDVQGGATGTGNLNVDPRFARSPSPGADELWGTVDDDYGDLRISAASPVVDAGANSATVSTDTDLAGNVRRQNVPTTTDRGSGTAPIVDMGAYEASPALTASPGSYLVLQGQLLVLIGRGASDVAGGLQYAWEWNGDGLFDDSDDSAPMFPVASFSPGSITISLRVTDSAGRSTVTSSSVRIAPLVAYVDASADSGTGSGADWENAFTSLAEALAGAIPGQTFRVATGTFKPTGTTRRSASFSLQSGIALYGGYAGLSDPTNPDIRDIVAHPTVLSGDIGVAGVATDNSYHVVDASGTDATAILDGFTITGGYANGTAPSLSSSPYNGGGGLFASAGSPTINSCIFSDNFGFAYSGAVYLIEGSAAVISNSTFTGNVGSRGGAAAADASDPTFLDCTFVANYATNIGGAIYNYQNFPTIRGCTFTANFAKNNGGAVYNSASSAFIDRCIFNRNFTDTRSAAAGGGAIANSGSASTITNSTFIGNTSVSNGGALHLSGSSPFIANCIFVGNTSNNTSGYGGGAVLCYLSGTPTFVNCTFIANTSARYGGAISSNSSSTITFINCILHGDSAPTGPEIYTTAAPISVSYSLIQGGYAGTGNINADPLFRGVSGKGPDNTWGTPDDDYGDLGLLPGSPAIDAGSNAALPANTTTDLAGNPRAIDFPGTGPANSATVDMGAYESSTNLGTLHLKSGQSVSLPAGGHAFSASDLILDPGASLDLRDSTLTLTSTPTAALRQSLAAGRLFSSSAAGTNKRLGYLPDGTTTLVKLTLTGDANLDGRLTADDSALLDAGRALSRDTWTFGDFNYDGQVTAADAALLHAAVAPAQAPAPVALVLTEPVTTTLEPRSVPAASDPKPTVVAKPTPKKKKPAPKHKQQTPQKPKKVIQPRKSSASVAIKNTRPALASSLARILRLTLPAKQDKNIH